MKLLRLMVLLAGLSCLFPVHADESPARVTVIFDAFGKPSNLERGWGYSALVEYGGKRILFDAGGQYQAFADNVRKLNIDLKKLDFVVISHRHGDHTGGLAYVLEQNPHVKIYAPLETGSFVRRHLLLRPRRCCAMPLASLPTCAISTANHRKT